MKRREHRVCVRAGLEARVQWPSRGLGSVPIQTSTLFEFSPHYYVSTKYTILLRPSVPHELLDDSCQWSSPVPSVPCTPK